MLSAAKPGRVLVRLHFEIADRTNRNALGSKSVLVMRLLHFEANLAVEDALDLYLKRFHR